MDIHIDIRRFLEIHVWICYGFSNQGVGPIATPSGKTAFSSDVTELYIALQGSPACHSTAQFDIETELSLLTTGVTQQT